MNYNSILAMALVASSVSALAVPITVQTSNAGGNTGTENIQFNEPGLTTSGLTVQGISNQSDTIVHFTGLENLTTPASGQARIVAADGAFTSLLIEVPGSTFTKAIFNLDGTANGSVTFTISYLDAVGSPFVDTFSIGQNGQNFFQVIAGDGANITSIALSATGTTFSDISQIRIGGFPGAAVPDGGATALLLGLSVLGFGAFRRKS